MSRLLGVVLLMTAALSFAQVPVGVLQGTVTDPAGAVIPNAAVVVENEATGVKFNLTTSAVGRFVQPALQIGNYSVTVSAPGFRRSVTDHVRVGAGEQVGLDLPLSVGEVSSSIEVTANAAQLQTESSTVNAIINRKSLADLPVNSNNRSPLALLQTVPGVQGGGNNPSISGGRANSNDIIIDGQTATVPENNVGIQDSGYIPIIDSVEEVAVITNALSAEYGRTGGGVITLSTRSGTNALHFGLFEFHQNQLLNANSWANNRNGVSTRNRFSRNQFGGSIGAPVIIPGLYSGRNKTFVFWTQQISVVRTAAVSTQSVPIQAWRDGNFADLLNGPNAGPGLPVVIYDPLSVSGSTRNPFVGNRVPVARFDKVAQGLLKYFPDPNNVPTNPFSFANNFRGVGSSASAENKLDSRLDHYFSEKFHMFVKGSYQGSNNKPQNVFNNIASPGSGNQYDALPTITTNFTYTVNPTTFVTVSLGFGRKDSERRAFSSGISPEVLGFPKEYAAIVAQGGLELPQINTGAGTLGQTSFTTYDIKGSSSTLHGDVTKIVGRHNLKFGAEGRKLLLNFRQLGNPAGQFNFASGFTQQTVNGATNVLQGFGFATFLLGLPSNNGSDMSHTIAAATASNYVGLWFADDYKVSKKLTLNIGLRWDVDVPRTERFNRLSYFDLTAPSPLAGKVPGYSNLQGAYRFVTDGHRRQVATDRNNWGPRFGFAYSFAPKTVFRGAYGILYQPSPYQAAGTTGSSGTQGYTSSTPLNTTLDNGATFIASLSNPFPSGYNLPTGSAGGAATQLGFNVGGGDGGLFLDNQTPIVQQWNGTIQRELPGGWVAEVGYSASKGQHLVIGENGSQSLNQLRGDQVFKLGTQLNVNVDNPFFGLLPTSSAIGASNRIQLNRLLRPYPQYNDMQSYRVPAANSSYHAFILEVNKRFSQGLNLTIAYTGSKTLDDSSATTGAGSSLQDYYNRKADKSISPGDISKRFVVSYNYELPFGKNHAFFAGMPKALDYALGNWQMNGIWSAQTGAPLQIGNGGNNTNIFSPGQRPNNNGQSGKKSGEIDQRLNSYFDTTVFSQAGLYTFGNSSRTSPNLRGPSSFNMDFSLFKTFRIMEKLDFQLRGEAFNVFNHPTWANPGVTVTTPSTFGIITAANGNRTMQVALKINY